MSANYTLPLICALLFTSVAFAARNESFFYPPPLVEAMRANAARNPLMAEACREAVAKAQPWVNMTDQQLWDAMFGATIQRSWMVLSDGKCPACNQPVPMYSWKMDAPNRPWKTQCPHCAEFFPKNDFEAFYRSGLDEHGVFDHARADRALLFNTEHPDPADPLHMFGVDDGNGFVQGDLRWRFIGAYLIFGHWYQIVLPAVSTMSEAYVVTGDPRYAHKTAVLLDRIADLYPSFDMRTQGWVYEIMNNDGYVTNWHDACQNTMDLAMAYDRIKPAMAADAELVTFLSAQAKRYGLPNAKLTIDDIQRNMEEGFLLHPVAHRERIHCNYPKTEIAIAMIKSVLDWSANREEVLGMMDEMIAKATSVDGVTGERGLSGYSYYTIHALAQMLQQYAMVQEGFLPEMIRRHPQLLQTWRFHLDTWCLDSYYPLVGDCGGFAQKHTHYMGLWPSLLASGKGGKVIESLKPSMYSFLWSLYQASGDVDYVRIMWRENGNTAADLPHDIYCADPAAVQREVEQVIATNGTEFVLPSVNKRKWHLGIMRSGQGDQRRALWMSYESGGGHGHLDGLNVGLFAHGLDLLPDLGYPAVQFGGWGAPRAQWYMHTLAHNSVVVNGKRQKGTVGECMAWADGEECDILAARMDKPYKETRFYGRTVMLADIGPDNFYVFDVFRVVGGKEHLKVTHSLPGTLSLKGIEPGPFEPISVRETMRDFTGQVDVTPGWEATWDVEDRYHYLPADRKVRMRYIDLTEGCSAGTAQMWLTPTIYLGTEEWWIPQVWVRRQGEPSMGSTFISVMEPYEGDSQIAEVKRLATVDKDGNPCESAAAVEVRLVDGRRDLMLVDLQAEGSPWGVADRDVWTNGKAAWIRYGADGQVQRMVLCAGSMVQAGPAALAAPGPMEMVEARVTDGRMEIIKSEKLPATQPSTQPDSEPASEPTSQPSP